MSERASVNVAVQFGLETTHGTGVAANKLLRCFMLTSGIKPDVKTYRGTGRRFPSVQAENREWVEGSVSGDLDYQGMVYLVSGPWGAANITTPGGGTNSRSWQWTPPLSGSIDPKTFTIEQGDSVRAHKFTYGLFTGFGYKVTRQEATSDATLVAQLLQDNITMTASPTAIALEPVVGKQINVFIDTTSGGIGTTQYTRNFSLEFKYDAGFGTFWPLNRSNTSFTGHVDLVPKNTVKLRLEADSQGMGLLPHLQAGDYLYLRVDAVGPIIESTIHYEFQHDIAIKLTNTSPFADDAGIYCIDYDGEVFEDTSWNGGQAQVLTITNSLTAL